MRWNQANSMADNAMASKVIFEHFKTNTYTYFLFHKWENLKK